MTSCKHNWHFVHGTSTLKCERCGQETGPRTPEQLAQEMLQDVTTIGSAWSKGGERGFIDGMQKQAQSSVDKAVNSMVTKKPWQGLTDEELSKFDVDPIEAKLMIAKLKEKST